MSDPNAAGEKGARAGGSASPQGSRELVQLGLLFGTMYFIQGLGEPTEGLIAQPVRSLLQGWDLKPGQIGAFMAIVSLPWSLKPLFGLLTDFVPLGRSYRRTYLVLCSAAAAASLAVLSFTPLDADAFRLLLVLLLVPTVGIAFSDVVIDALMVEKGQPRGITGRLQAIQWSCLYAASILTGTLGGMLSEYGWHQAGFLICACFLLATLVMSLCCVREEARSAGAGHARAALIELTRTARTPVFLSIAGFLFLFNFNPFTSAVLQWYLVRELKFGEQFYGYLLSLAAVSSVAASVAYGFYCRRVPMRWLFHGSVVFGILSTLCYVLVVDRISAVLVTLAVGFSYTTASLIQFDLAARICPPQTAGTVFAALMAMSNFSDSLAIATGGHVYEQLTHVATPHAAFRLLVLLGATLTAGCWCFTPWLARRE